MRFNKTIYLTVLTQFIFSHAAAAQGIEDAALNWLQAFLQVDTVNPPGNESRAVEFLGRILEAEGIPYETAVSPTDTVLYEAIESVTAERHPGSRVMPVVQTGFTDSYFTRDLGIASYGFDPIVVPLTETARTHGNDERINVEAFRRGVSDHLAIIQAVVYDQ